MESILSLLICAIVVVIYFSVEKIKKCNKYSFIGKCTRLRQPKKVSLKHNKKK